MSTISGPAPCEAAPQTGSRPEPPLRDQLSVVIAGRRRAGSGAAELWCGSVLLGIVHEDHGGIVLRLASHARGAPSVSAVAFERALAEAREGLEVAARA